jgi:hypothetical protein
LAPEVALVAPKLVAGLVERIRRVNRPVVLIDGGSGSGKSTLAQALAPALDAQLLRLEDIYPGWDGLEAACVALRDDVLGSDAPGWRSWDWSRTAPAEWHELDATLPLVIEGSGSLSRANRALATYAIWIELDTVERRRRAIARDGDRYAPHWERWAAQEAAFAERERPSELADAIVDARTGKVDFNTPAR